MAIALNTRQFVIEVPRERTRAMSSPVDASMYTRRRIMAAVLAIGVVWAACLGLRAVAHHGGESASVAVVAPQSGAEIAVEATAFASAAVRGADFYVVQPGDTMWSIASSLTDGSIRSYVRKLVNLNGGEAIAVGQRLSLPHD